MQNNFTERIIMWALTYNCNMSCQYCFLSDPSSAHSISLPELSLKDNLNIAEIICSSSHWKPDAVWLTGGEPTLREELIEIIIKLNTSRIFPVITTNGKFSSEYASLISECRPRAISISLDSQHIVINDKLRSDTYLVLENIKYIANNKHFETILGVSIVIDNINVAGLFDFANYISSIGVEYLSINLRYNQHHNYFKSIKLADLLKNEIYKIKSNNIVRLPSKMYLDLLDSYCRNKPLLLECPATKTYFFISPWGLAYPCSAEFWHVDSRFSAGIPILQNDLCLTINSLSYAIDNKNFDTSSPCFGTRCLGCWKIYYDNIIFGGINNA